MDAKEYKKKMKTWYTELYELELQRKILTARIKDISKSVRSLNQYLVKGDD
jgi:hypothetical protein